MNIEELPDVYFDLIQSKPYAELTVHERAMVDHFISRQDYDAFHEIVRDSRRKQSIEVNNFPEFVPPRGSAIKHFYTRKIRLPIAAAFVGFAMMVSILMTWQILCLTRTEENTKLVLPVESIEEDGYPENFIIEM